MPLDGELSQHLFRRILPKDERQRGGLDDMADNGLRRWACAVSIWPKHGCEFGYGRGDFIDGCRSGVPRVAQPFDMDGDGIRRDIVVERDAVAVHDGAAFSGNVVQPFLLTFAPVVHLFIFSELQPADIGDQRENDGADGQSKNTALR